MEIEGPLDFGLFLRGLRADCWHPGPKPILRPRGSLLTHEFNQLWIKVIPQHSLCMLLTTGCRSLEP